MSTESEWIPKLYEFLLDSFSLTDLKIFLTLNGYQNVAYAVNENVGGIEYCLSVSQALARRGLINEEFFDRLKRERPHKGASVQSLRDSWFALEPGAGEAQPQWQPEVPPKPSGKAVFGVSYAWEDASKAVVDQLCEEAKRRGIDILRDTTGVGLGQSITRFMQKLGAGDRVFVILSEKYLKSPFCMFELLEVWRNARMDDEAFRRRIRVYRLPDARMMSPIERARHAKFWKDQFKELDAVVREGGADLLGKADFERYKLMQDFALRVGDMLAVIADTLQPRDFEELKEHGFAD